MTKSGESILRAARQARAWARGEPVEGFVVHTLDTPRTSIYPPGFSYGEHTPIVGVETGEPRGDAVLPRPAVF